MKSLGLLGLAIFASLQVGAADRSGFHLRDGDRVVFYGDSITDQRLYTTFTETYAVTRFPKMNVTFVHSGWGGDRVTGGGGGNIETRLTRDVFPYKPTVMSIMLGMNDASYRAFDENIHKTYTNGYQRIIDMVQEKYPNARITAIVPSPFDDVTRPPNFEGGYNEVLLRYGKFIRELAERENLTVADLNTDVVAAVKKADASNHDLAVKLNPDRVHPAPPGQLLMAAELLQAWNAPALVTAVEIDAAGKKVVSARNALLKDVRSAPKLSWTQLDQALPMPIDLTDPVTALAVKSSDFMETLNQQTLKVTGLDSGRYSLKIDGEDVGSFSSDDLSKGVNLAMLKTPMMKQAQEVHRLTLLHNDVHFVGWRQLQVKLPNELDKLDDALESLEDLEQEIVKKQRAAAQPKAHKFELSKAE